MSKQNPFKIYAQEIRNHYTEGNATEHTYRPALERYLSSLATDIRATNEPKQKSTNRNKPDLIVCKNKTPLGYIETKDIGIDLDETADSEQITRYLADYPNLVVTDYLEFRRYVNGKPRTPVRIGKTREDGITFFKNAEKELSNFFEEFLVDSSNSVSSSLELADRLAGLTRQIKKLVKQELDIKEESTSLHNLLTAFQKTLISDLDENEFSDMFAQTLAYGFFAARVHFDGKGEFSRRTASNILPKTNPFLRKLFREFADERLPERLIGAVDEIVELLKKTDIEAILKEFGAKGRNDAVIHFYESFLGAFNPQLKKDMGVFYTPDPVVDFMVRSLDEILIKKFGRAKGLADDKTLILDPALGTGSFLNKIIDRIREKVQKGVWDSYVADKLLDRIFGFEILMAPYAVAHLNLGIKLQKTGYSFEKSQRLGVYLTNTLDETAKRSEVLFEDWLSEEANAAAAIKRDKPIMVVTGNPPYAAESQNDGKWIRGIMRGKDSISGKSCANYFECDGEPLGERCSRWINDDYVKFIRFAHWRIEQTGHGVLAFITNHGYLDNPTFRGMRQALMRDFDEIFMLDLHGNSKKKETAPDGSKDQNVFDIQQGVSICFLVRKQNRTSSGTNATVYRADIWGDRKSKFDWLLENSFESTPFKKITPEKPFYVFSHQDSKIKAEYYTGISIKEAFKKNSVGMLTAKDSLSIHFKREQIWNLVREFSTVSAKEADEKWDIGKGNRDWKIEWAQQDLKKSGLKKENITPILYRPFDIRYTYYTGNSKGFICYPRADVMNNMVGRQNIGLVSARSNKSNQPDHFFITTFPTEAKCGESTTQSALFPLYLFNGKTREINLTDSVLDWASSFTKQDPERRFLEYAYAIFFSDSYRERYKDFLKLDFPRIPKTDNRKLFLRLAQLGSELIDLHLLSDPSLDGGSATFDKSGSNIVEKISYDSSKKRVYINSVQYFDNVKAQSWEFQVGGYQVLEKWLKDRKNLKLSPDDIFQYEKIVESINRTFELKLKIEKEISSAGGWPIEVTVGRSKTG